jgi:hypothetical protein
MECISTRFPQLGMKQFVLNNALRLPHYTELISKTLSCGTCASFPFAISAQVVSTVLIATQQRFCRYDVHHQLLVTGIDNCGIKTVCIQAHIAPATSRSPAVTGLPFLS